MGNIFKAEEERFARNAKHRERESVLAVLSMEALEGELAYRRALLLRGKCSFCGKARNSPPCEFPERHAGSECR